MTGGNYHLVRHPTVLVTSAETDNPLTSSHHVADCHFVSYYPTARCSYSLPSRWAASEASSRPQGQDAPASSPACTSSDRLVGLKQDDYIQHSPSMFGVILTNA